MSCSASLAIACTSLLGFAPGQAPNAPEAPPSSAASKPQLHAAFASSKSRQAVPAIAWLCEEYLPSLPSWPSELDPAGTFAITLSADGIKIRATTVAIPVGTAVFGSGSLAIGNNPAQVCWQCDIAGREQWLIPADFELDPRWTQLLQTFEADLIDTPRTIAVPVLTSHLAGAVLENDPRSALLRLAPSLCGDATWLAWQQNEHVHVCGQSGGGLMLPFVLLAIAVADGSGQPSALSLRAFSARDPDQAEATRQLGRSDRLPDISTLRSLLHAEDQVRMTAIDALIRQGVSEELPHIVEAADPASPWTTIAAKDAVQALWAHATKDTRAATRRALQQCNNPVLQKINLEALGSGHANPSHTSPSAHVDSAPTARDQGLRARILMVLFCLSVGLLGLWSRERALLRIQPA